MGSPRRLRKKYSKPLHPWRKSRIDYEKKILEQYGLKNKREIWKTDSNLRRILQQAKRLISLDTEQAQREKTQLINRLMKYSLLKESGNLDDVLSLKIDDLLNRRLQTFVYRKNLANSVKQARQFIVHRHISVNGQKTTTPSYMVKEDEEDKILYSGRSPLSNPEHPEINKIKSRMKEIEIKREKVKEEKKIEEKKNKEERKEKVKKVKPSDKAEKKEKKEVKKKEDKK